MSDTEDEVGFAAIVAMLFVAMKRDIVLSEKNQVVDIAAKVLRARVDPRKILSVLEDAYLLIREGGKPEIEGFFASFANEDFDRKQLILMGAGLIAAIGDDHGEADQESLIDLADLLQLTAQEFSVWREQYAGLLRSRQEAKDRVASEFGLRRD